MNRKDRRRHAAMVAKMPLPKARLDGRPLYYDVGPGERRPCYICECNGLLMTYGVNDIFMNDPANAPDGSNDIFTICRHHLPDDAVIYNQATNLCRNKEGSNSWEEPDR